MTNSIEEKLNTAKLLKNNIAMYDAYKLYKILSEQAFGVPESLIEHTLSMIRQQSLDENKHCIKTDSGPKHNSHLSIYGAYFFILSLLCDNNLSSRLKIDIAQEVQKYFFYKIIEEETKHLSTSNLNNKKIEAFDKIVKFVNSIK